MTNLRSLRAAIAVGAVATGTLCGTGIAGADPNTVAPTMLNTTCTLDQIMAATKVADPVAYGAIVEKYNSEPGWVQGGVIYHLNLFLQKSPQQRQAEIAEVGRLFPQYAGLFTAAQPVADAVAAQCATFPATDPGVWSLNP